MGRLLQAQIVVIANITCLVSALNSSRSTVPFESEKVENLLAAASVVQAVGDALLTPSCHICFWQPRISSTESSKMERQSWRAEDA
ncbi:unnamed protein product [Linum trigynum]|uniref:Secreted protein n=1 Tax=Linum trigynum TaxID=586398 RepID=A0AAV2F3V7_9ROSI